MKSLFTVALVLVSYIAIADSSLLGTGTGFVVAKHHLLTAAHVVERCDEVTVSYSGKSIKAKTLAIDLDNDLAILSLPNIFQTIATFRGGVSIRLGAPVINYGYPLVGELSDYAKISKGEINSLAGRGNDPRVFQYDASTQPGNSGGPVLDQSGNVVGVVSYRHAREHGINFAIKSYFAEHFLSLNGVRFQREKSVNKLDTADIAEKADAFTALVACWEYPGIAKTLYRETPFDSWIKNGAKWFAKRSDNLPVKYVGEVRNTVPHGSGVSYLHGKEIHAGEYRNGLMNGPGTAYLSDGRYVGNFTNGQPNDWGTRIFKNGSKYIGEFRMGIIYGQGRFIHTDGGVDVGEFRYGKPWNAILHNKRGRILGSVSNGIWRRN